jgi:hypothetical protein
MESGVEIQEGSKEDQALAEITAALSGLANEAGNTNLSNAVRRMDGAWEAMDGPGFVKALDETTALFDAVRQVECPN